MLILTLSYSHFSSEVVNNIKDNVKHIMEVIRVGVDDIVKPIEEEMQRIKVQVNVFEDNWKSELCANLHNSRKDKISEL